MRKAWLNRNTLLLASGQLISTAGDQVANVAFLWLVTSLTGSAAALGMVMTALVVPNIIMRLVGGLLVDRWPRRAVMAGADLWRGGLVLALAVLALRGQLTLSVFLAVAGGLGVGSALFAPALSATTPLIVSAEYLPAFNSFMQVLNQGAGIVVPPVAGILVAAAGAAPALGLDGASFLISALTVLLLALPRRDRAPEPRRSLVAEATLGWRTVMADTFLPTVFIMAGVLNFADALVVIYPVHLKTVLGAGPAGYGLLQASVMTGLLAASVAFHRSVGRLRTDAGLFRVIAIGALVQGAGLLLFGLSHGLSLALVGFLGFGVGMGGCNAGVVSLVQRRMGPEVMGRVFSLYGLFALTLTPVGYAVAGAAAKFVGTGPVMQAAGGIMMLTALGLSLAGLSLWRERAPLAPGHG